MKHLKKFLALALVLLMAVSVLPSGYMQADAAKKKTVAVKKVTLNKKSATLLEGKRLVLKASLSPKNTTQKKLTWSSSDKKIATVSTSGVVKAVKEGKATITVKVKGTNKKATCRITVIKPVKVKKITLNAKSASLYEGSKKTLKVTFDPKNTTETTITWSTSNKKVATVTSKGVVKAVKKGTATITAKVKGTSKKATCKITVKAKKTIKVSKVSFSESKKTIQEGATYQTKVTVSPSNAANKAVTYKSSNTSVATVDSKGKVTAKKPGSATITATAKDGSGKKASCVVTVKAKPPVVVKVTSLTFAQKEVAIEEGTTYQTKVTVSPSNASNKAVTYKSSNTSVATVDANGKVTAKKEGNATITATAKDGSGKSASMKVVVKFAPIRYVMTCDKDAQVWSEMMGDTRRANEGFRLSGETVNYFCYNTNVTARYKSELVGTQRKETITILEQFPGMAHYAICGIDGSLKETFAEANVKVEIYKGDVLQSTLQGPQLLGQTWLIASYHGATDTLEMLNRVSESPHALQDCWYGDLKVTGLTSDYIAKAAVQPEDIVYIYTPSMGFYNNPGAYLDSITVECRDKDADIELSADDEGIWIKLTNTAGRTREYWVHVYQAGYDELEITEMTSDAPGTWKIVLTGFYSNDIVVTGSEEKFNSEHLNIKCGNKTVTYEVLDEPSEEGCTRILLKHSNGAERRYTIHYTQDYTLTYPGFEVLDISSTDGSITGYQCELNRICLLGSKSSEAMLENLSECLEITFKDNSVEWRLENGSTELVLSDDEGKEYRYSVVYVPDDTEIHGGLCVTDITSNNSAFLGCYIGSSDIYIYGTKDFEKYEKDLKIETTEKGVTYKFEHRVDEVAGDVWYLTLTAPDGRTREYIVYSGIDKDALYGDFEVLKITHTDVTACYIYNSEIQIYGIPVSMEAIEKDLTLRFGKEGITYTLDKKQDATEESDEAWILTLKGKDGRTRQYEVEYKQDLVAYYGDLKVKDIVSSDESITNWYVEPNATTLYIYAKALDFAEIADNLSVTCYDTSATGQFENCGEEDGADWQLVLKDTSGKERRYEISFETDYDGYYGNLVIESMDSKDGSLTDFSQEDENIWLKGTHDTFEEIKDQLTFTFKNNAEIETEFTDEDEEYWILTLTDSDGKTRRFQVYYKKDYGDLEVVKNGITSTDGSVTQCVVDDDYVYIYTKEDKFPDVTKLVVTTAGEDIEWQFVTSEDGGIYLQLSDGENERRYSVYYVLDYGYLYGDLGLQDCSNQGTTITDLYFNSEQICVSAGAMDFKDVKDDIQYVLTNPNDSYECKYFDEDGCWYLVLTREGGKTRKYLIVYTIDYGAIYGDLKVETCIAKDDSILSVDTYDTWIDIFGIHSFFEDIADRVEFKIAEENATCELKCTVNEDSQEWRLIITSADGERSREYQVYYYTSEEKSFDEVYSDLYVSDVQDSNGIVKAWRCDDEILHIAGNVENFEDVKDSLVFTSGREGVQFNIVKNERTSRWEVELIDEEGWMRVYKINYMHATYIPSEDGE